MWRSTMESLYFSIPSIRDTPCRRRNGGAVPRAENIGGLIKADHKVLSENGESRNNHKW